MAKITSSEEHVMSNSASTIRKTETSAGTVITYVPYESWLKSILEPKITNDDSSDEEDISNYQFEDDLNYLRSLDPKEWKDQDHYAVLGISKLRHKATEDIIKRAYKYKILKHHPDKRKAMGEEIRADDDYFTCITRAWEILGTTLKRRSYDSVDPFFNDDLPDEKKVKENFYEIMGNAFKENARWSIKKNVPKLGNAKTPREEVEKFYSFWYDFESWREFSYLDEEDKESGQDRDIRKWIEKKNKAARAKRKKEEMARIRSLVDMAYNSDPRIKKFHQEDKERKSAVKRAKQEAIKAKQLEEERIARESAEKEKQEKEKREAEEKAKQDLLKQQRDIQRKALRKERKALRDLCKSKNYFAETPEESIRNMESVEKICELFKFSQLEDAVKKLQNDGKSAFSSIIAEAERQIEAERRMGIVKELKNTPNKQIKSHNAPWSESDLQLLIKAVNLFPAGTNQRWEVVANFINQHSNNSNGIKRDAKEVLAKAKDLQSTDFSKSIMKEQANKKAFDNFIADKKSKDIEERMPAVTERLEPLTNGNSMGNEEKDSNKKEMQPWTIAEQKLLEQALKTYPTTVPDRWELIANCIPTRTKKDCMRRCKELVELVKAKKAARDLK